ncbi:DNA replication/repair protein RecF [Synoicihabitans lomoniglobus]|uniref:DNA replication and repair protein RecF n=1 Tax=Synoicihabitans lomoniglobus TaxID=2909285 RepID=A0AAE9ZZ89_9BACT|nr:DNA replication and repair protein RecF [Opitutaceae bacterium LMO-M01]WED63232.1 DNA replication and repair protein RecF [Opitutaceae bacterium LMO-M01]
MQIRAIALQHFRNIPATRLELSGRLQFFVGPNGQGKTNLLEAAGFVTALRSFRSADAKHLICHGQPEAALAFSMEHEQEGDTELTIKLRAGVKEAWLESTKVTRLADVIGRFPTVVFSSQDQQLVRGSPGGRRRWLDLTLSATDKAYFVALQAYHRALAERNALLKRGGGAAQLAAFEQVMADHGVGLIRARRAALAELAELLTSAYAHIADHAEPAGFAYAPDGDHEDAASLAARFAAMRNRDLAMRSTSSGPHRDDFDFMLHARQAKTFASEGQQRALVLSLRLAQATWFHRRSGVQPTLLADDVLGELDPARRQRFWAALPRDAQVLATGTTAPDAELGDWQVFAVDHGEFVPVEAKAG